MFTNPVTGDEFFNRADSFAQIAKRINAFKEGYRQNIAIIGEEHLGKTSIIAQLLSTLPDKRIIPIYVEVRKEDFKTFSDRFIGSLLYHTLRLSNIEICEDVDSLIKQAETLIPRTHQAIGQLRQTVERNNVNEAWAQLLQLSQTLNEETGKFCLVIFDEFHHLAGFKIKGVFSVLGKKIMVQKRIMYVVTSSYVNIARKILAEKLSLLFGNFEIVEIQPFKFEDSRSFIKKILRRIKFSAEYENFLIIFCDGHPFYLDVLLTQLRSLAYDKRADEISEEIIIEAFTMLLFNPRGILNQYFTSRLNTLLDTQGASTYLGVLRAIAEEKNKAGEIAKVVKKRAKDITSKQLSRLCDMAFIVKNGVFYRFSDKVFRFWFRFVYQMKARTLLPHFNLTEEKFQKKLKEVLEDFLEESKRDKRERIAELFKLFRNEIVQIDLKGHRLLHFEEVYERAFDNNGTSILVAVRTKDRYWLCSIKDEKVTEEEIREFSSLCRRFRKKIDRKIVVALDGVDSNARLLAKEEKMWTWNLRSLNLLLDLYGKPQIVK